MRWKDMEKREPARPGTLTQMHPTRAHMATRGVKLHPTPTVLKKPSVCAGRSGRKKKDDNPRLRQSVEDCEEPYPTAKSFRESMKQWASQLVLRLSQDASWGLLTFSQMTTVLL